jgi:chemotaxis methyl-accepting protein methylase
MRARGQGSFDGYAALLDQDPEEYQQLLDTLTINVTKFFRNTEVWNSIREVVVPSLFGRRSPARIWSAGSASGEEAYSIAIVLHEWAERNARLEELGRFQIVGTDIDRRSLELAEQAVYPELSLQETPEELRGRWFSAGPPYRLRSEAQRHVSFTRRDLISEAAPQAQSLILCRNVIIYFDREIQEKLFQDFYDALIPGGFLVLGKVETLIGPTRGLFRSVNNRERIFQKPA